MALKTDDAFVHAPAAAAVGYCNDKSTSCAHWAKEGECSGKNAEYLAVLCPHSCATCTHTCEDTDVSCGNWAKSGQCKDNQARRRQTRAPGSSLAVVRRAA